MKITGVRLHLLQCRLPEPQGNALAFFDRRAALLVEIRSDEGTAGWGETWHSHCASDGRCHHPYRANSPR